MYLSVVIPAYNEEQRIWNSLTKIYNYLEKRTYDFEIIVIDDGSNDKTVNLLEEYSKTISTLNILKNKNNQGKGYSVKRGVLESKGDIILFTDADLSTPIEEMDRLIKWLNNGYQIAIGSRALPESQIKMHQPWYREIMGIVFNRIICMVLDINYYDTQCGFKCFQRSVALEIFKSLKLSRFSFDVEVLLTAKNLGISVKEVPVCWYNSQDSKVRLVRDSLMMLLDIFRLCIGEHKILKKTTGKSLI